MHSEKYNDKYTFFFTIPGFNVGSLDSSSGIEEYEKMNEKTQYILGRLGYSEKEVETKVENSASWAKKLSSYENMATVDKIDDVTYTREKVIKMAGDFPMEKILEGWGLSNISYIAISPDLTKKLSTACKESASTPPS